MVAVAVVTLLVAVWPTGVKDGGPVGVDAAFMTGAPVDPKQLVGTGAPEVYNASSQTAVVEDIGLEDPPAGLKVVKKFILDPNKNKAGIPAMARWPDPGFRALFPVDGYRIAPDRTPAGEYGARLVFVMRIREARQYNIRGTWIRYRIGDQRYRASVRSGLVLCGGLEQRKRKRCKLPDKI